MQPLKPLPTKRTRLDNGATVVTARLPHLASPHVVAMMRSGPVHEDEGSWGMSHLLEHMVFRGTKKHRTTRAVSLAADDFGGEIGGSTYRDRVVYDTRVDAGREDEALALLCEMLAAPRFEGLEIEKDVLHEELLELYNDDGDEICPDNLAARSVFAGSTLARSIEGTLEGLEQATPASVRRFHQESYGPEHLVLAAAGPVSHAAFVEAARKTFGRLPAGAGPRPGAAPEASRAGAPIVVGDEASQTQVRLAFPCAGVSSDARWALSVLARVLDDGPAARFPARLIDGAGLAYSLWVDTDLYEEQGTFEVGAQVAHDRVGELVAAVCRELDLVRRRAPSRQEVERVHRRVARDLLDVRDDPAEIAETVAQAELRGTERDPRAALARIEQVGGAAVRRAAAEVFQKERATLVMVGLAGRKQVKRATRALETLAR